MKMMTLEEAKEYTRQKLAPYYDPEKIENIVNQYVSVARPGVVLVRNKNVGLHNIKRCMTYIVQYYHPKNILLFFFLTNNFFCEKQRTCGVITSA